MKLVFGLTRIQILFCIGAFLLAVFSGFNILPSQARVKTFLDSPPIELTEGWQYRWGDSPINEMGIPIWTYDDSNLAWKPFKVPGNVPIPQDDCLGRIGREGGRGKTRTKDNCLTGRKIVWLRIILPEGQWKNPSFDGRGVPYIEAYLGNKLIDKSAELDVSGVIKEDYWPIIPLDSGFPGKMLFFKAYAEPNNYISVGTYKSVVLGSQTYLIKQFVQQSIGKFVLGCFFTGVGIFSIFTSFKRQELKAYLSFGILAICTGIFTIFTTEVNFVFFKWSILLNRYVVAISYYMIPVGICIFFEQIIGTGYKLIVRRLWQVHLIYTLVALTLSAINIAYLDYTRYPAGILIIFTFLTLFITSIKVAAKGNVEAKLFTIGFAIFGFFGLHDILVSLKIFSYRQEIYYWGLLIFIVFLGFILERRFFEARKRLQAYSQELEVKNLALQQMDKLKDEFLANTSHELRTPLNGIIGIAESMIDGAAGQLTPRQVANLAMVVSSGRRLSHLVNDILDFSKLKHKNIQLQIKPVDMRTIADVVLALSQPLVGQKPLKLVNKINTDVPAVNADENRVQQILYNLVGNAVKFTDAGVIEVSAEVVNRRLYITVSDTGIGIPVEKQNRIFESFEQVDGVTREYSGTGLGLAISKQLVELHGGEIHLESTVGNGTHFTFTLPLAEYVEGLQGECLLAQGISEASRGLARIEILKRELADNLQPASQNGDFKILIVDDEPVNLQVLANHLSLQNYSITQASNGIEALNVIQKGFKPDLILLDVMMPRMTGYEVCQRIREQFPANEVPVVLLTAKDQVSDLVEGFDSGANDYLAKPIIKTELLARIKTHIQLSNINKAYARFVPHEFLRFLQRESIVDVKLGDQVQKEMTILFSDIRSFTTLSERMTPKENFDFINSYLSRVGPVIRDRNGFIDKYIGDAVMALFPETAEDALLAAIDMQKQVALYNEQRQNYGYPCIYIGIGLHTGSLMLGTIGEEQRMETTVIADAVNLASRLEGLTKLYGAGILTSEQTLSRLDAQKYNCRFLDKVRVKGKKAPVAVFEIYDGDPERLIQLKTLTRAEFERGVFLYQQQKFAEAQEIFLAVLQVNDQDKAAGFYIKRCEKLQKLGTAEGWDGFETLEEKL